MQDILKTQRLILRRFVSQDAQAIFDAMQDSRIAAMIPRIPWPYAVSDAAAYIKTVATDAPQTYAITIDGVVIGAVGANGQLGYWLRTSCWGQGITTEAAHAVVTQRFNHDDSNLKSSHRPENNASRRVLEKLGFTQTPPHVVHSNFAGADVSMTGMVLTASDWKSVA